MAKVRGATATSQMRKNAGGGKFLSLSDGDEVEVAFAGVLKHGVEGDAAEPMGVEVVWLEGKSGRYSVEYDPKKHREDDMKVSFMWNVLVRGSAEDGSEDEMKIFQQGGQFFDQFIKHKDKKGYHHWFSISRTGSGQFDTKYSLDREDPIEPEDIEDIKKMDLHDLDKESSGREQQQEETTKKPKREGRRRRAADAPRTASGESKSESKSDNGKSDNGSSKTNGDNGNGDTLVSNEQRDALKTLLSGLPDPLRGQALFTERFKVSKLRELTADQFDDAKLFIETVARGGAPEEKVDDPFLD